MRTLNILFPISALALTACPIGLDIGDTATHVTATSGGPTTEDIGATSTSGGPVTGGTPSSGTDDPGTTTTTLDSGGDDSTGAGTGEDPPGGCAYVVTPIAGLSGSGHVAADFDLDGKLDLAARTNNNTIQLFFGDGTGVGFAAGPTHAVGGGAKLAPGDFDGDGRPDLVHYDQLFDEVFQIQLNTGGDLGPIIATPVDALFYTFRVADIDGDGDSDLSHGGNHSQPLRVWTSDAGVLTEAHQLQIQACYATASAWADFDGDGDSDLAVIGDCNAVLGTPPITVHLRDGRGYTMVPDAGIAESGDPPVLEPGDFDGDGKLDVVTQGYSETPSFELHRGAGDGTFAPREPFPVPNESWVKRALDGDGDGLTDLVTSGPDGTVLHRSTGQGFEPCPVGPGQFVEAADLDGDGRPDILLSAGGNFTLATMP